MLRNKLTTFCVENKNVLSNGFDVSSYLSTFLLYVCKPRGGALSFPPLTAAV